MNYTGDGPGRHSLTELSEAEIPLARETEPGARVPKSMVRLRLFWEHRGQLRRTFFFAVVASALIAYAMPARYESTAQLMPPDPLNSNVMMLAAAASGPSSMGGSGLGSGAGSLAGSLLGLKSTGALYIGILQSRTVRDDLIAKFNLRTVYWDQKFEDARKDLEKYSEITEDRKSGIVSIQVTDRSPQRAAAMAQEYVDELNRVLTKLDTSSAHRERVFLEQRLDQVKSDLEKAENGFSRFASDNNAIDVPSQGKAMIEAASVLEGQLIAAQTELQGLRQIYADGNVRVRATEARVHELQAQLDKLSGATPGPAPGQSAKQATAYPSIRELPILGVPYADLYRNAKIEETIFETLTREYELAKIEEAKETPSAKVLDSPEVPEKKSSPSRLLIILGGTLFCLAIASMWILGSTGWSEVDVNDPTKVLAMEVYATMKGSLSKASKNGNGHPELTEGYPPERDRSVDRK